MTNINPQLSEEDIDSARRLMKKDNNNVTVYGPNILRFKNKRKLHKLTQLNK